MNNERIAEIRARCEAATPGPWEVVYHNEDYGQGYRETTFFVKINDCLIKIGVANNPKSYEVYDAMAKGIVLDHQDIPALLDAYTEQAAEIAMLRKMQPVDFKGDAANQMVLAMELAEAKAEIARLEGLVEMLLDDLTLLPDTASRDVIVASAAVSVATMYKKSAGLKAGSAGNGAARRPRKGRRNE